VRIVDTELKLILGKLLGETYRIQKAQGNLEISDSKIFGLVNGIEEAIETELDQLELISNKQMAIVMNYLDQYYNGDKELPTFVNVRLALEQKGISHGTLIDIFKYLKAGSRYNSVIDKLGNYELPNTYSNFK
jgi:hypothetical protein